MRNELFKYLANCLCDQDAIMTIGSRQLKTTHQFHVCFYDGPTVATIGSKTNEGKLLAKMHKSIQSFLSKQFRYLCEDKKASITNCLKKGQAFIIYEYHHNGVTSCILFSTDEEVIFVN